MEIERKLAEEQKKKENKKRWAKEKLERKAAYAKGREPWSWNGLSPAQQQAIIEHNQNIKNQKKKFRKHMAKAYKKDGENPFKVPKLTFKNDK
ncbi:unnamed protein product [Tilletia laevis]|uniref:Uncharacterized protein n=2 Tax=Tilletia TaxID=13289 RepID=A0A177VA64_9BASI|nr:hypothetical protein CF336_g4887 [Tilletia laevis]KAE8259493.1 hypothetical protein A4X03_0g4078 [Tilletia caries]KAE8200561.1 hypothetical protein CF335_g3936 [Tilletia laevis]CAD6917470.1 unnamed protein product [Tilletia caries]CAD6919494.1 unnamed protein product [Tilletia laevis]